MITSLDCAIHEGREEKRSGESIKRESHRLLVRCDDVVDKHEEGEDGLHEFVMMR